MEKETPKFTVIVPCRNRAPYLQQTLKTCTSQDYDNLEIIVSDDASCDNTREVVEDAMRGDKRVRAIFQEEQIGMRDNFENTLREVKDGYVIALGGDDGILPDGITGMKDAIQTSNCELIAWPAPVYHYANVHSKNGQLMLYHRQSDRIVSSRDFLTRQARGLDYLGTIDSPMFYVKGVASIKLINQVKSRSPDSRFYSCATPDGYSGIVLAGEVEQYAFSGSPFSIYGLSPSSQGMAYLSNEEEKKNQSLDFFERSKHTPMHEWLASAEYSPLVCLMTADYLLKARDLPGWPGVFPEINIKRLLSRGVKELSHGLYGEDRISRELAILLKVARHHGLEQYLKNLVKRGSRKKRKAQFEGSGVSPTKLFLDCGEFEIKSLIDASCAAKYYCQALKNATFPRLLAMLTSSITYKMANSRNDGGFPEESTWVNT